MRSSFLFLVTAVTTLQVSASTFSGWSPCSSQGEGSGEEECAIYKAPLCHPGICEVPKSVDNTVDIFVKRYPATKGDVATAPNVWLLQGGPEASSLDMEMSKMLLHVTLGGSVNIYVMDQRGTGRSTRFDCGATTAYSPSADRIEISEIPSCAKDLQKQFGDLSSFSVTSAATDLKTFIAKYTNKASTTVYGVSYGTILVERLIHLAPPKVTGYVLDSVATTSGSGAPAVEKFAYMSTYDTYFGEVGDAFMALCKHDKDCSTRFKPHDLQRSVRNLIKSLDEDPNYACAVQDGTSKASYTLRKDLGWMLLDETTRTLVAPIVYRSLRCSKDDVEVLTFFYKTLYGSATDTKVQDLQSKDDAYRSYMLNYLIQFSEMWETPQPSMNEMIKRFTDVEVSDTGAFDLVETYCAFSKEDSPACNNFTGGDYDANGIIYERDQYWNKSATIPKQASVLLLNGGLDPQTPLKFAKYLLASLKGENKELVTFDYATQGVLMTTFTNDKNILASCGIQVLASYVKNDGDLTSLDKSCLKDLPAFNMTPSADIMNQYLSTDHAYDGVFLGKGFSGSASQ